MKAIKVRPFIAMLLCVLVFASLFGCGDGEPAKTEPATTTKAPPTTTAPPQTTAPTTTEEPTTTQDPGVDVTGYTFRLGGAFLDKFTPKPGTNEMHDRWNQELLDMQLEHGFTLEFVPFAQDLAAVTTIVMAGDDPADFVFQRHGDIFIHAVAGRVKQLDGEELKAAGLNVWDRSKWDPIYTAAPKFNDKIWGIETNGEYYVGCFGDTIAFNPLLTEPHGYPKSAIYQLVRDNKWTWEKFLEIARLIPEDTDADNELDIWGVGSGMVQYAQTLITNDYIPLYRDNTGKWIANFENSRYINALEFIRECGDPAIRPQWGTAGGAYRDGFSEGKIAFNIFYGWTYWEDPLASAEFAYGVVPTPMGIDAKTYISTIPEIDIWTMLVTNKNVEKSVKCMNLWGDIMTNDRWEDRVKTEFFRDDESWEMFEKYIFPNSRLNFQQASREIWLYIRNNIVIPVLDEHLSPIQVVEGHNEVMQGMLDDLYNK